jgi:anti-sigma factor RsiW
MSTQTSIDCAAAQVLLAPYRDGELDVASSLAVDRHVAGCDACTARLLTLNALRTAVRNAQYHRAPAALRLKLDLREPSLATPAPPARAEAAAVPRRQRLRDWQRWAMPLAASVLLSSAVVLFAPAHRADRSDAGIADEVVAGHVRSLLAQHLADVPSTDQHTVKPWFNGKLDYAPPVRDFAQQDFPLTGGRLDYIGRRTVAALVYRHRQHVINLFVWPHAAPDAAPVVGSDSGYNLLSWTAGGMDFWAVSDLNAGELRQFVELERSPATPPPSPG